MTRMHFKHSMVAPCSRLAESVPIPLASQRMRAVILRFLLLPLTLLIVPSVEGAGDPAAGALVWNGTTLGRWLAGPPEFIPGVHMQAFLADRAERQNLIACLKSMRTTQPQADIAAAFRSALPASAKP
jgi:hypothetical protein